MERFFAVFALCFASVVVAEQFYAPVSDPQHLFVEQETQRRLADVFGGLNQAHHFQVLGSAKLQAARLASHNEFEENGSSFLELKEEFFPFMGGFGFGGQPQAQQPQQHLSAQQLQKQSTESKITALKYFFIQLMSTQSDVQLGYWMNKAISAAVPQQYSVYKLYKNYLSTFALSNALQLHDAFTLEAYLEAFNSRFNFGSSAQLSESVAEMNVYTQWQQLVTMRLFLFYISMYETSFATQAAQQQQAAANPSTQQQTAFLEVETEAEPSTSKDGQQYMLMQYYYMAYFSKLIKFYSLFYEMMIPQSGLQMAQLKVHGYRLLTDGEDSNDEDGHKFVQYAEKLDNFSVSGAIAQWAGLLQTRYMMEYFLVFYDMYLPQLATQRIIERVDSAILNSSLFQTEKAEVKAPAAAQQ